MTATAPPPGAAKTRRQRLHGPLLLILALGLVHSLVYVCVFPPWQHYDEPSHLEYALLIAKHGRLPRSGDYDLSMRQEIASSMMAENFYRNLTTPSIDYWSKVPPSIGVDELVHPPLYYLLLALAIRPFEHQGVEVQLYVGRLCSVALYLVVLLASYRLVAEAFPTRPLALWLPAAVATFLALLPPFTDRMSSVNNDAGATAATSLLLWAAVVLVRRGISPRRLVLFLATVGLCLATKTTAGMIALTSAAVLAASFVPARVRRWLAPAVGVMLLALLAIMLASRGRAAGWYSVDPGGAQNRAEVQTPLDHSGFALAAPGSSGPNEILQELPVAEGRRLRGHTVTLGGWVRSDEGTEGNVAFRLDEGDRTQTWHVKATSTWEFHTFTMTVGEKARGLAVHVSLPPGPLAAQRVFLDGLLLIDASLGREGTSIADAAAARVRSADREWENLLRNGSAERRWPGLPTRLGNWTLGRSSLADVLSSVLDWRRTGWVLQNQVSVLFKSYWGGFGWFHLVLPDGLFYGLGVLTGVATGSGALGAIRRLGEVRRAPARQRRVWLILAAALAVGWGMALLRIHPVFVTSRVTWPAARYADTVVVPSAVLLCGGLAELVPRRLARAAAWAGLLGLLTLDAVSLGTVILPYYYQ